MNGALIGAGYFAQFHAEGWSRIDKARIVAVADPMPGRAMQFADRWGIPKAYESIDEMLDAEQVDFVDIATRPETHRQLVAMVAARAKHVICQKPMAPTWNDCVAMVEACQRAGVRLMIHENWRWQPWYRQTRRLLDDGVLGKPFNITFRWRTGDGRGPEPYTTQPYFREMPLLLVYETLVHLLDTFRFLLGEIATIYCQTDRINPVIVGEDQAIIHIRFRNQVQGVIDANRISGPFPVEVAMGTLSVEGDRAALRMTPEGRLWLTPYGRAESEHAYTIPTEGYKGDSVRATQAHLVNSLVTGQPSESDGQDYLSTIAAVEACYRSAQTGEVVPITMAAP